MRQHAAAKAARSPYVDFADDHLASGRTESPAELESKDTGFSAWLDEQLETLEQHWSNFQTNRSIKHSLNR